MISRKNGPRLKKLKTMKKKGGMFDRQTFEFFKKSRPVSSKTKLKSTALSGQTKLILQRLGIPTGHNPQSSMQFATQSYIKAKQRETGLANKLLEDGKELRKRNDFVNAALVLRQAIELGSLPARAELADFFRTGRTLKDYRVLDDYYGATYEYYDKAHALVYDQDDPDCK
jgi:TPR repeat protein